ncbi:conjugative transposon protein TraM [Parapedobacter sp. DT-150]|uniref:conjugative transposon protein TraM n=1 Tax=Parapedobacter sp. DT-150 TaxID=3396162 RepID=UPI003F1D44DF
METPKVTPQMQQRRKFLLALPILVLPFAALAFHALGGGQGNLREESPFAGINTGLPEASFRKEQPTDKLAYYEQARRDSAQRAKAERSIATIPGFDSTGGSGSQEQRISEKLALIEAELARPDDNPPVYGGSAGYRTSPDVPRMPETAADVERLERMMDQLNRRGPDDDPEMQQLNGMLERILDIQHPERVQDKLREQSLANRSSVYPVTLAGDTLPGTAIRAAIHRAAEVTDGATVQLRLLDSVYIDGRLVPRNSFVHGTCQVDGERLTIRVRTLRHGNAILPVALSAYDMDGLEGLCVPGAMTRDAAKQGSSDAIQSMQLMSMDPSLAAQAATVGVNAAKGLLSRKVRQVRVRVKAGYEVLLRDGNQR